MNHNHIKELARARAREILSSNSTFRNLSLEEQKKMYQGVVEEQINQLMNEEDLSEAQLLGGLKNIVRGVTGGGGRRGGGSGQNVDFVKKSGELINDARHNKGFEDGVDAFEDLVDSVDFPQFVKDLLQSVFDANISVMKAQTDDYIKLMKEATTGLAKFIKQIDDTTTFAYLAENNGDEFNLSMEEDDEGNEKMTLADSEGEPVDMEDNEVKAKIMDAKIKMAQEHRAALREMILMGVTRLVVEKGEVEAEVNFEFKGKRKVDKKDKAMVKTGKSTSSSDRYGGGLKGWIFGGPKGGSTSSTRQTQLSVSSTKSTAEDELKAKLRGYVNIKFKTDYFKLDNFAQMYGPPSQEEQQAAAAQRPTQTV
ncbi:MAG: hypothetical protein AAF806_07695 [Bacteroidota bacterium]